MKPEAKPMLAALNPSPPVMNRRPFFPANRLGEEVNDLARLTQFKVRDLVMVTEHRTAIKGKPFWLVRYTDPNTKADVRLRFTGLERDEVRKLAEQLAMDALNSRGYIPGKRLPTIAEALAEAIELSGARPHVRKEYARMGLLFGDWLAEQHASVKRWDQLRPAMVQRYVRQLEEAGRARDTVRLRLFVIKMAWRYMAENYPETIRPLPRIQMAAPVRQVIECLELAEAGALLEWLREKSPDLWPMACLQALAGLRMLEASALRVQDVDLEAGLVTVTDTGVHKPKTRDSWRTIPVCRPVREALKAAIAGQKIRPASGEIFTRRNGKLWTMVSLSSRWCSTLPRAAKELGLPRLAQVPARKLRATFATSSGRLGANDRLLKGYMGHAAGDVLGSHYRRIETEELKSIAGLIERAVLDGGRQHSGINPKSEAVEG